MSLTFDSDGGSAGNATAYLNILTAHELHSTWFVTGEFAQANPAIVPLSQLMRWRESPHAMCVRDVPGSISARVVCVISAPRFETTLRLCYGSVERTGRHQDAEPQRGKLTSIG